MSLHINFSDKKRKMFGMNGIKSMVCRYCEKETKKRTGQDVPSLFQWSFMTCMMSFGVQSKLRHSFSSVQAVTLLFFLKASKVPVEK